jgi:hypothetical protein
MHFFTTTPVYPSAQRTPSGDFSNPTGTSNGSGQVVPDMQSGRVQTNPPTSMLVLEQTPDEAFPTYGALQVIEQLSPGCTEPQSENW